MINEILLFILGTEILILAATIYYGIKMYRLSSPSPLQELTKAYQDGLISYEEYQMLLEKIVGGEEA